MNLGDYAVGDVIYFGFTTRRFSTGAPYTLAGSPAVRVYKDDSTTEDDSGITLTTDFDGRTGMNVVKIDTSQDATFYAAGADYMVVITAGTVDSVSVVGEIVAYFSIANRTVKLGNVSHGGVAAVMTLKYVEISNDSGNGVYIKGQDAEGLFVEAQGSGNKSGILALGIGSGAGLELAGGEGINITGTDGHGVSILATGASKHGINVTGGNSGTSDGIKANAGTGGVPIRGSITGDLSGSVGSLATQAKADVNAEVLDVLNVDTFAQPGQETPAATTTIRKMLAFIYKAWRNKIEQTDTTFKLYNDDAATVDQKATTSDNGTTFTRTEIESGP